MLHTQWRCRVLPLDHGGRELAGLVSHLRGYWLVAFAYNVHPHDRTRNPSLAARNLYLVFRVACQTQGKGQSGVPISYNPFPSIAYPLPDVDLSKFSIARPARFIALMICG
jgi:hypothetical protein